ncbi:unnamed protein product [Prorocentrum cordatum]|uniref:Uncharacterized protein n=1 Tax=Prorocentrum cordatum TaxID=2364126 RepID=A0ABN9XSL0_9DINO|nr:unnamed protein product [Polarella glacialis]
MDGRRVCTTEPQPKPPPPKRKTRNREDCLWNFKRGIPAPLLAESSDSEEGEERAGPSAGAPQGAAAAAAAGAAEGRSAAWLARPAAAAACAALALALGLLALRRRGGAARSLTRGLAERGCAVLIVMSASAIMSEKRESAAKHRFGLLEAGGQPGSRGAQPRRCRVPTSFGGAPRRADRGSGPSQKAQEASGLLSFLRLLQSNKRLLKRPGGFSAARPPADKACPSYF